MQKLSSEVFGIELKYFDGAPELHGRYDEDRDVMYVNVHSETSLDWTFWHEAFHVMKEHEPELYEDILKHVEGYEIFSSQQIEEYRKAVKQPTLSKAKVTEELLADAFADMKTGRRVIEKISTENQNLANRLAEFTKKLLTGMKNFFKAKEVREKYPEVALTNRQFKEFVTRVDENICSANRKSAEVSTGYKILSAKPLEHSPHKYAPTKQRDLDMESAKELLKKYSADEVQQVIQDLSPLGRKDRHYGREILREVKTHGR